ncbi:MAG TPA: hypothetical protein VH912_31305 [Streptosporangiaceae bacterium]|jgi:hypothetical protein
MDRDSPSVSELAWRLNEVYNSMQRLVSQELYIAEQRASERRFTEVERDIELLRARFEDDLRTMTSRFEHRDRERGSNWRQSVYAGVIPTALLLISLVVQVWLSVQENH